MSPENTSPSSSDPITNNLDDITDSLQESIKGNPIIEHIVGVRLLVEIGNFHLHLYHDIEGKEHLALVKGELRGKTNVLTRIHSECLTGDLFGSMRCDCGPQLRQSMKMIEEEGTGLVIYLRQEGRGIGLAEKLKAYNLQDQGFDTVDANLELGYKGEEREYDIAAHILEDLGIGSIQLLSNNPAKVNSLGEYGINVESRLPLPPPVTEENVRYLETKVTRMDHKIDFNHLSPSTPEREEILRYVKRNLENALGDENRTGGDRAPSIETQPETKVFTTLSYFQGLEGCMANPDPNFIGGMRENLLLKGQLRQLHDAIISDSATYLSLYPALEELFPEGFDALPVLMDVEGTTSPDDLTVPGSDPEKERNPRAIILTAKTDPDQDYSGFTSRNILVLPIMDQGYDFDLTVFMRILKEVGVRSVVVEAPQEIISSFINHQEADLIVSTVLPCFLGSKTECYGSRSSDELKGDYCVDGFRFNKLRGELVYYGLPDWKDQ